MICKYSNLRIEFWYSRSVLHLRWHECRKKNWSIVLACKIFSHIRPKIQTLFPVVFVNIYAWLIAFGEGGPCLNLFKLWMNFMMFYLRTFQQPKWITMGTLSVLMDHSVFQNKTCSKGRIVENQNINIYFFLRKLDRLIHPSCCYCFHNEMCSQVRLTHNPDPIQQTKVD